MLHQHISINKEIEKGIISFYNNLVKIMKIFCLSLQRSGTKSVGGFLRDNGFSVCTYRNSLEHRLQLMWHEKKIEELLRFVKKSEYNAYEDSPWWHGDLYKYIYNNISESKFILLERDPNKWFDSMIKHSGGKNPGNSFYHSETYGRLETLDWITSLRGNYNYKRDNNILDITQSREHYLKFHWDYHAEIKSYFNLLGAEERLFYSRLETTSWTDLADFVSLKSADANYSSTHSHITKNSEQKLRDSLKITHNIKKSGSN